MALFSLDQREIRLHFACVGLLNPGYAFGLFLYSLHYNLCRFIHMCKDLLKYWNLIEIVFVCLNGNHKVMKCEFASRSFAWKFCFVSFNHYEEVVGWGGLVYVLVSNPAWPKEKMRRIKTMKIESYLLDLSRSCH